MIHIINEYYAESDNYGYTVLRDTKKTNKKGKRVYKTLGYCGNLTEVLVLVRNDSVHKLTSSEDIELSQVIDIIKELNEQVMKALEGIEV